MSEDQKTETPAKPLEAPTPKTPVVAKLPEGWKDKGNGIFAKKINGKEVKVRNAKNPGYKQCPDTKCGVHVTARTPVCPVCDKSMKPETPKTKTEKKVERVKSKDVRIIAKMTKAMIEGDDFVKPTKDEPTAIDMMKVYKTGDSEKIDAMESLATQWGNWNEMSDLGSALVKSYKKTISETLFPSENNEEDE